MAASIDQTVRFVEGDYTATEILTMDLPLQKSIIQGRIANMARSKKKLEEQGKADSYTKMTRHGM